MTPETQYARAGDAHIAYQVLGNGPIDIVLADQWFSHMEAQWDVPPIAKLRERLASFSRLIMFDKRGIGLSDPVPINQLPTLEEWIDDLRAVMDAAGSERASLVTNIGGALMAIVCAASFPDRVSSLVIVDGFARNASAPDYPMGEPIELLRSRLDLVEANHGRALMVSLFAPSAAGDEPLREAYARYERQSASPGTARAMVSLIFESDVRDVLPTIRVPTLVIHHRDVQNLPIAMGRYLAEHIPGAKFVELPGVDNLIWAGDQEAVIGEIQEFTTGIRTLPEPDRVLATVLFTDIVDSTVRAAALGDRQWRALLDEHDRLVRASLARGGGREIKTTGDGFLATFDGPARAVRAAGSIRDAVAGIGLQVRAGLHTGEIELAGNDVAGVAVHIASRVASLASAGEILV
ncbi:MAG TPA: adenylate/guanylate cyclase domain-containing protein, partial [Candidatus Limnocylindria bacterium]|nr:adenylate/guanylate cyclase domain-containing protein [Candidatus Limnocylindria bacterium]